MYVNYGCGHTAPTEWVNFDSSFTLKFERTPVIGKLYTKNSQRFQSNIRFGDIVTGLPVADGACKGVYASHVLEHLPLSEFHVALRNTQKMLKDGGIFRLVVPDLEWAAREYLRRLDEGKPEANGFFLDETRLGVRDRKPGLRSKMYEALRTSRHFWMWDEASLSRVLAEMGFRQVRRCHFGDCRDEMFRLVEAPERFENAVGIEAIR